MSGVDSMDLLRRMLARRPDLPVVMLAGDPSVPSVVVAMRQRAFHYVIGRSTMTRLLRWLNARSRWDV
jgi:DNA-binding NtrC family response regulator